MLLCFNAEFKKCGKTPLNYELTMKNIYNIFSIKKVNSKLNRHEISTKNCKLLLTSFHAGYYKAFEKMSINK